MSSWSVFFQLFFFNKIEKLGSIKSYPGFTTVLSNSMRFVILQVDGPGGKSHLKMLHRKTTITFVRINILEKCISTETFFGKMYLDRNMQTWALIFFSAFKLSKSNCHQNMALWWEIGIFLRNWNGHFSHVKNDMLVPTKLCSLKKILSCCKFFWSSFFML